MSKNKKIREYLRKLVLREIERQKEIDEASTTATAGVAPGGPGHYFTPMAFSGGRKKDKKKKKKISHAAGMKPVNESYGEMMDELEKIYRPSGAPPIAKEALKDLADEYDIGRLLYAARTNKKAFMEVMDMKIDQLQSQHVNKKHINTIKRGKKLREGKKRFRQRHGIGRAKYTVSSHDGKSKHKDGSDFFDINIFKNKKDLNNYMKDLKRKGYVEESINEGRYHDYRNDESMTPKQKIGRSMREIRDALNELDKTVKMNLRLKNELKVDSRDYWKNTHKALTKISERLVKMANKVGNLK